MSGAPFLYFFLRYREGAFFFSLVEEPLPSRPPCGSDRSEFFPLPELVRRDSLPRCSLWAPPGSSRLFPLIGTRTRLLPCISLEIGGINGGVPLSPSEFTMMEGLLASGIGTFFFFCNKGQLDKGSFPPVRLRNFFSNSRTLWTVYFQGLPFFSGRTSLF